MFFVARTLYKCFGCSNVCNARFVVGVLSSNARGGFKRHYIALEQVNLEADLRSNSIFPGQMYIGVHVSIHLCQHMSTLWSPSGQMLAGQVEVLFVFPLYMASSVYWRVKIGDIRLTLNQRSMD